jgi:hypothetical protein
VPILRFVKQVFNTSVGTVEVLVDSESRVVSVYRFDEQHRFGIRVTGEDGEHVTFGAAIVRNLLRSPGVGFGATRRGYDPASALSPASAARRRVRQQGGSVVSPLCSIPSLLGCGCGRSAILREPLIHRGVKVKVVG